MIAIAQDHGLQVALPPFLEVEVIILSFLRILPAVKRFIDHHHADAIACVEEVARRRIVAGANRIKTIRLQDFHPALLGPRNTRSAEHAVVVVYASTLAVSMDHH